MTTWFVTTPEYDYHEVVLEDGSGPTYTIRDCEDVQAESRREAVQVAVRKWLASRDGYCYDRKRDGLCPWTGIRAESEDEVKAKAKAAPPPPPDERWTVCDECVPAHDGAVRWFWKEDDIEWGWYGTCREAAPVK